MKIILFLLLIHVIYALKPRSLRTKAIIPTNKDAVHDYLATADNWPSIVLSSFAVNGKNTNQPMKKGDVIEEVFGLPPLLPLAVEWKTIDINKKKGVIEVVSPSGIASGKY